MKETRFPVNYNLNDFGGPFSTLRMDLQAHVSAVSITVPGVTAAIPFPLDSIKTAQAAVDGGQPETEFDEPELDPRRLLPAAGADRL